MLNLTFALAINDTAVVQTLTNLLVGNFFLTKQQAERPSSMIFVIVPTYTHIKVIIQYRNA